MIVTSLLTVSLIFIELSLRGFVCRTVYVGDDCSGPCDGSFLSPYKNLITALESESKSDPCVLEQLNVLLKGDIKVSVQDLPQEYNGKAYNLFQNFYKVSISSETISRFQCKLEKFNFIVNEYLELRNLVFDMVTAENEYSIFRFSEAQNSKQLLILQNCSFPTKLNGSRSLIELTKGDIFIKFQNVSLMETLPGFNLLTSFNTASSARIELTDIMIIQSSKAICTNSYEVAKPLIVGAEVNMIIENMIVKQFSGEFANLRQSNLTIQRSFFEQGSLGAGWYFNFSGENKKQTRTQFLDVIFNNFSLFQRASDLRSPTKSPVGLLVLENTVIVIKNTKFVKFTMISEEKLSIITLIQSNFSIIDVNNTSFSYLIGTGIGAPSLILCKSFNRLTLSFIDFYSVKLKISLNNSDIAALANDYLKNSERTNDIFTNMISAYAFNNISLINIDTQELFGGYATILHAFLNNSVILFNITAQKVMTEYFGGAFQLGLNNRFLLLKGNFTQIYAFVGGLLSILQNNFLIISETNASDLSVKPNLALNEIESRGGILSAHSQNSIIILNAKIAHSFSALKGGAFYLYEKNYLALSSIVINNPGSFDRGGLLYSFISNILLFENVNIAYATSNYGAVFFLHSSSKLVVSYSNFTSSLASIGGVVYSFYGNEITIFYSKLSFNRANEQAACIYAEGDMMIGGNFITLYYSKFLENEAKDAAGVFYLEFNNYLGCLNVSFDLVISKKATFVYSNSNNIIIMEAVFLDNIWGIGGNIIYLHDSNQFIFKYFTINNAWINGYSFLSAFTKNIVRIWKGKFLQATCYSLFSTDYSNVLAVFEIKIKNLEFYFCWAGQDNTLYFERVHLYHTSCIVLDERNCLLLNSSTFIIQTFQGYLRFNQNNMVQIINVLFSFQNTNLKEFNFFLLILDNVIYIRNTTFTKLNEQRSRDKGLFNAKDRNSLFLNGVCYSNLKFYEYLISVEGSNMLIINSTVFKNLFEFNFLIEAQSNSYVHIMNSTFSNVRGVDNYISANNSEIDLNNIRVLLNETKSLIVSNNSKLKLSLVRIRQMKPYWDKAIKTTHYLFQLSDKSDVTVDKLFLHIKTSRGNPFFIEDSKVNISMSKFFMNHVVGVGGGIFYLSSDADIFLTKSLFFANSAKYGSIFFINEINQLSISNSKFYFNKATRYPDAINFTQGLRLGSESRGGIFYLNNKTGFRLTLTKNYFVLNKADIGGIFFSAGHNKCLTEGSDIFNNNYLRNKADLYGDFQASNISSFHFASSQEYTSNLTKFSIKSPLASNKNSSECLFYILPVDVWGNFAKNNEEFDLKNNTFIFNYSTFSTLIIMLQYKRLNGGLCVLGFRDLNQSLIKANITLTLLSSDFNIYQPHQYFKSVNFTIEFQFRVCELGEFYDIDNEACNPCPTGYYSFIRETSEPVPCSRCENLQFYCYGGANITPKPGFWRLNATSERFFICPNKKACTGDFIGINGTSINENAYNPTLADGSCRDGYKGYLCAECENDYGLTQPYTCTSCSSAVNYLSYVLKLGIRIFIFCYSVWKGVHLTQNLKFKQYEPNADEKKAWDLAGTNSLIKIFLNHSHILYSLMNFPFDWPDIFNDIFSLSFGIFSPDTGESLSFECILKKINLRIPLVYFQLLVTLFLPTIIAMFVVAYFSYKAIKSRNQMKLMLKHQNNQSTIVLKHVIQNEFQETGDNHADKWIETRRHAVSVGTSENFRIRFLKKVLISIKQDISIEAIILIVIMLTYFDIIHSVGYLFFYINLGYTNTQIKMLLRDTSIAYENANHQAWRNYLGIPLLILLAGVFPVYIFIRLFPMTNFQRRRHRESTITIETNNKRNSGRLPETRDFAKNVEKKRIFFKFGYFYYQYRDGAVLYEILILFRRGCFVLFDIFFIPLIRINQKYNPVTFLIILMMIIWIFFMIHLKVKPYKKEIHVMNHIESLSFITLIFCYFLGSIWLGYQNDITNMRAAMAYNVEDSPPKELTIAIFVICILLNLLFIVLCLRYWVKYEWLNLVSDIHEVLKYIKKICNFLICKNRKELKTSTFKEDDFSPLKESILLHPKSERKAPIEIFLEISEKNKLEQQISRLLEDKNNANSYSEKQSREIEDLKMKLSSAQILIKLLNKELKYLRLKKSEPQLIKCDHSKSSDFKHSNNLLSENLNSEELEDGEAKVDEVKQADFALFLKQLKFKRTSCDDESRGSNPVPLNDTLSIALRNSLKGDLLVRQRTSVLEIINLEENFKKSPLRSRTELSLKPIEKEDFKAIEDRNPGGSLQSISEASNAPASAFQNIKMNVVKKLLGENYQDYCLEVKIDMENDSMSRDYDDRIKVFLEYQFQENLIIKQIPGRKNNGVSLDQCDSVNFSVYIRPVSSLFKDFHLDMLLNIWRGDAVENKILRIPVFWNDFLKMSLSGEIMNLEPSQIEEEVNKNTFRVVKALSSSSRTEAKEKIVSRYGDFKFYDGGSPRKDLSPDTYQSKKISKFKFLSNIKELNIFNEIKDSKILQSNFLTILGDDHKYLGIGSAKFLPKKEIQFDFFLFIEEENIKFSFWEASSGLKFLKQLFVIDHCLQEFFNEFVELNFGFLMENENKNVTESLKREQTSNVNINLRLESSPDIKIQGVPKDK